uniref:Uncharacterized protein n=1 Tax=Rhizophora mucronata TaxID=61149 RepID=A0A2P2N9L8_RHIMU
MHLTITSKLVPEIHSNTKNGIANHVTTFFYGPYAKILPRVIIKEYITKKAV